MLYFHWSITGGRTCGPASGGRAGVGEASPVTPLRRPASGGGRGGRLASLPLAYVAAGDHILKRSEALVRGPLLPPSLELRGYRGPHSQMFRGIGTST